MINLISFFLALIVITILISIILKQKAENSEKPLQRKFKEHHTNNGSVDSVEQKFNASLVLSKWAEITAIQDSGPSGLKSALFEADKLLDYCMIGKGFAGDTMGDRLKNSGGKIVNLNSVWSAHKLRNQLAHEVEHDVVASQVKASIKILGEAIVGLGIRIK